MSKTSVFVLMAVLSAFGSRITYAHHSSNAVDRAHPVTLSGTVKEFVWSNPHSWIQVMVPDGKGGAAEWRLEGGAVNNLVREGWSTSTLQPGMKIKLLVALRKDSAPGGEWLSVLEVNGQPFVSK